MTEYNVTFSVEGSMTVTADSPEAAEKIALDECQCLMLGTEDYDIDAATVRVAMQFTYDEDDQPDKCTAVDRPPKVVEFA